MGYIYQTTSEHRLPNGPSFLLVYDLSCFVWLRFQSPKTEWLNHRRIIRVQMTDKWISICTYAVDFKFVFIQEWFTCAYALQSEFVCDTVEGTDIIEKAGRTAWLPSPVRATVLTSLELVETQTCPHGSRP